MNGVANQINFNGNIFKASRYYSKNLQEVMPELSKMIKEKPYDVTICSEKLVAPEKECVTSFYADNWNYLKDGQRSKSNVLTVNKTLMDTTEAYKETMDLVIKDMDAKIKEVNTSKKVSLKNKIKNAVNNLLNK